MTKDEAIKRLQKDTKRGQRFNDLLPLLGGMKAPQQHRYFNRAGYSAANLKSLEYDIKQAYGIKSADLRAAAAQTSADKEPEPLDTNPEDPEADKNPDATPETTTTAGSTTPGADQTLETTEEQKGPAADQGQRRDQVRLRRQRTVPHLRQVGPVTYLAALQCSQSIRGRSDPPPFSCVLAKHD